MDQFIDQYFNIVRFNIKKYRKEKGFTQEQLAEKIGYSIEYVREIESPTKNKRFSLTITISIANCLGVPLYNFFK